MLINTSLLRERFTITDKGSKQPPLIALGNRLLLPLTASNGQLKERFVVRAHSMHIALRMAAKITEEFYRRGPVLNRQATFPWKSTWNDIITDFERPHTPQTWCCVYHKGRPVFQHGDYHPFLDIIEQCDIKNRDEYDRALYIAEDMFKQAGRNVAIDHQINIGLVIGVMEEKTRCGLILRAPKGTTTFNFQIEPKGDDGSTKSAPRPVPEALGFDLAANFLEGIQLAVSAGFAETAIDSGDLLITSPQAKKTKASYNRIGRLNHVIEAIESSYAVRYRPERPDFQELKESAYGIKKDIMV